MRTDNDIRTDVIAELHWDPSLKNQDIAVAVRDGIVTLAGYADSYASKWTAERVASKVRGVKGIANDIEVRLSTGTGRPDPDIARAAVDALKWNISVPHDRIKVKVSDGWVTLEGEVDWFYQRDAAERSVRYLTGVKGITNLIAVKARPVARDVTEKVREALRRGAEFDAERVTVDVEGSTVTLRGTVRSYAEMRDAERAAMKAPGVTKVENRLVVDPYVYSPV